MRCTKLSLVILAAMGLSMAAGAEAETFSAEVSADGVPVVAVSSGEEGKTFSAAVSADGVPVVAVSSPEGGQPGARKTEKATFLGVTTSPVPEVLRTHFNLPKDVALLVDFVRPDSPADKAALKKHDILTKLDDQILVNFAQLRSLIRAKKPDQTVQLSLVREGKPLTVSVKLEEKQVPVSGARGVVWSEGHPYGASNVRHLVEAKIRANDEAVRAFRDEALRAYRMAVKGPKGNVVFTWPPDLQEKLKHLAEDISKKVQSAVEQVERSEDQEKELRELADKILRDVQSLIDRIQANGGTAIDRVPAQIRKYLAWQVGGELMPAITASRLVVSDGDHKLDFTVANGQKHLTAMDKAGKVFFSGPVQTEDQRKGLPAEVRAKLEALDKHLSIEGDKIIVSRPHGGKGITARKIEIEGKLKLSDR